MSIQTFLMCFGTFAAFVAGVTTFTEFFKNLFKVTKKGWMMAIAWILAIAGSVAGFCLQTGFFAEYGTTDMWQGWLMTGLTGIGAGIAANGLYDLTAIESIIKWIWSFMKPNQSQTINE